MKKILMGLLAITLIWSCGSETASTEGNSTESAAEQAAEANHTPQTETGDDKYFGEKITPDGSIAVSEMIGQLSSQDTVVTKLRGSVVDVCQVKGCWVNIKDDQTGESVFVKFKDYGFFMPLDCAGRKVVMDGQGYKEVVSVDELRHYAEDAKKSAEEIAAITEPEENFRFMASGVMMLD